jgi:signal transduction histidine kinase
MGLRLALVLLAVAEADGLRRWRMLRNEDWAERSVVSMGKNNQEGQKDQHVKQLEELSKLTGELAHEIKNPLSTIKINLKLIREQLQNFDSADLGKAGPGRENQAFGRALRKIAVIEKEADRLDQILDGFLRYVTKPELQLADVDVSSVISDMIDFYSPQAYSHSIIIRQQLYNQPLICRVDADTLKQAVLNLFINAQQAMSDRGELMVRTDRRENCALIQISDTGHGIAPDKLPNIFSPHCSSRPDGSGLGLPTTRKIVEAHHGTITVDSELGKGTSFTIKLPLQAR